MEVKDFLKNKKEHRVYMQIGTYNGKDEFCDLVREFRPWCVLLIEPNPDVIEDIGCSYEGVKGMIIENIAIVAKPTPKATLYLPHVNDIGRADNGHYYQPSKFSVTPMNDWGNKDDMQKIEAGAMTMNELFRKYNISNIDYLCLSTEGYDSEILKSFDMWKHRVDILKYKIWDFDSTLFARHNENWDELGDKGMDCVQGILTLMGYNLYDDNTNENVIAVTNRKEIWKPKQE